eukprot:scaffold43440_cov63-Phaeocystis_antarctica.AAC.3
MRRGRYAAAGCDVEVAPLGTEHLQRQPLEDPMQVEPGYLATDVPVVLQHVQRELQVHGVAVLD